MKTIGIGIAATLMTLCAPATAGAAGFAAGDTTAMAPTGDADKLVNILVADDAMTKLIGRAFDTGWAQEEAKDPQLKAIYAAHPGLREYISGKAKEALLPDMIRSLPQLRAQLVMILTTEMSPGEIKDVATFFATPAGRKLYRISIESMGNVLTESDEVRKAAATAAVMKALTPEDYPALATFGASAGGAKMKTVNPKLGATSQAWSEQFVTTAMPRITDIAKQATADFLKREATH